MPYFEFEAPHQQRKYTGISYSYASKQWFSRLNYNGSQYSLGSHRHYDFAVLALYKKLLELAKENPDSPPLIKKIHEIQSTWDVIINKEEEPFDTSLALDGRLTPFVKLNA